MSNSCRASLRSARHSTTLLHSLVLCAAVGCMVGLLCAASYDVSGIPAVNMRIVFALFIACAPFALQPLAHARAILACEGSSCKHCFCPMHDMGNLGCNFNWVHAFSVPRGACKRQLYIADMFHAHETAKQQCTPMSGPQPRRQR